MLVWLAVLAAGALAASLSGVARPTVAAATAALVLLLALLAGADYALTRRAWRAANVRLTRRLPAAFAIGVSREVRVSVEHDGPDAWRCELHDHVDPSAVSSGLPVALVLPAGKSVETSYTLVPTRRLIANVEGVMNAILVKGDAVGATMYYGAGAGSQPTASAVVADLVDVTRLITADPEHRVPHLAFQPDQLSDTPILPIGEVETSYYLRMRVLDKPGVLARITRILADSRISIGAMVQKEPGEGEKRVDIVLLTHRAIEKDVNAAMVRIEKLPTVLGKVTRIRLEELL